MNLLKTIETEIDSGSCATDLNSGKPRILYVVTRAERGGAQTHVLDLACSMRPGFEVSVATGEEGFLTEACREREIPVYVLPHLQRQVRPIADARAFREIWQLIRKLRPDLLHLHTFKAGFLARLAGRILGIPSVYTIHAWLYGTPAVSRFSSALSGPCERVAARWCERIITVSRAGARVVRGLRIGSPSKLVTIHNGLPDCSQQARLSPTETPVITMVARFIEGKDHDLLLRAFARIPKGPRLRLVGDGPTRASVESLARELGIQEQVDFLGNRDDVPSLLATSDVFVLASRSEMLPISILEAMRAGLPVIASDVGGVGEAITHNESGFLVPSGSISALTQALTDLTNNYALRLRMGQTGRQRFTEQFLSSSMEERTRSIYWDVLLSLGRAGRKRNAAAAPASMPPPPNWQTA
jgi:glycosyltransferase involved in cell wall biosynthesis